MKLTFLSSLVLMCCACLFGGESRVLVSEPARMETSFYMASKGQNAVPATVGGRPALWIEYNRAEAPWCAMDFRSAGDSLAVRPCVRAVFEVDVYVPEEADASWINIRLADRDGEVFQISGKIDPQDRGWRRYELVADTRKTMVCWAGRIQNKRLDFPVRLQGLSIDFRNRLGAGRLALGEIRVVEGR